MVNSQDLTITEGRARNAIEVLLDAMTMPQVDKKIKKAVENERIHPGKVTKFYPYLDKAEVKLDKKNKKVLCRILHRFGGNLVDFYTPVGTSDYCEKLHEPCILPRDSLHCLVLDVQDGTDEYILLGYDYPPDIVGFKPPYTGAMKIFSWGASKQNYIEFGGKGLKIQANNEVEMEYGLYDDDTTKVEYAYKGDVYTKDEVDSKLGNCGDVYETLLEVTEKYKLTSNDAYYLFRGDCWTINNNFESSAAITSTGYTDFTVTGTFRTENDLIGLYWNSKDPIEHPYISYGERSDYRDVVLDFDYEMEGCKDFSDNTVSITIRTNIGEVFYLTMNRFISSGHVHIDFNDLTLVAGNQYIDADGNLITVTEETPVDVSNIQSIMFVIIPDVDDFTTEPPYVVMENTDFICEVSNIQVKRGNICREHVALEPHKYRLCEGYDDFYNLNPKRVTREMRKLGYAEWCDLYIGASHYYEKSGTVGDTIPVEADFNHNRTEKMTLDPETPLNKAFIAWLDCYAKELKANDCPNLVLSVSMENLQCPTSWRQKDVNGNYAMTGWIPSTFFYSPCNDEPVEYMKTVSKAVLDIAVDNDMRPILQMGEAWWWWNESDKPNQPPCFYDNATKTKYENEFSKPLPEYGSSWSDFDGETIYWLNQELTSYVDALRTVVKCTDCYTDGLYLALFFPPSVLDTDRVPKMMREVNYIDAAYHPTKLDILQVEDYDWVTGLPQSPETTERDRSHHPEAYKIGEKLGFTKDKTHYFGGFVQYPENAIEYWKLIQQAMDDALELGFAEVYVWAGSQIRRDKKIIGYPKYELVQQLLYNQTN